MDFYLISYGLTFLAFIITLSAQLYISSSYKKFKKVTINKNINGKAAARKVLDKNGLSNVEILKVSGSLTDHYDPSRKTVSLSTDIYEDNSIASIAVACHECGHAIQDKEGYLMLRIRHALIPLVNISSYAGYLAIMIGVFFSFIKLVWLGIIFEVVILLFQLVTLPVEFNASSRALKQIKELGLLSKDELKGARTMLVAAALTYVASVAATVLEILRLVLIFGRRDD
jgi:Zn-dependent membrane protease YugP